MIWFATNFKKKNRSWIDFSNFFFLDVSRPNKSNPQGSSTNHVDRFLGSSDPSPNMDQFSSSAVQEPGYLDNI